MEFKAISDAESAEIFTDQWNYLFPFIIDKPWPGPVRENLDQMFTINSLSELKRLAINLYSELYFTDKEFYETDVASQFFLGSIFKVTQVESIRLFWFFSEPNQD